MDIYWRDAHKCPTEEEYKEMVVRSKLYWRNDILVTCNVLWVSVIYVQHRYIAETGGLFGLAVRMMQLFSDYKS